jgi:hypothetical protein
MRRIARIIGVLLVAGGVFAGFASSAGATKPAPEHKVTLCHRTGSATNPYIEVTVDIASSGYVKGGHNHHEQVGNGLGGDIIPAYTYGDFSYPGKGLDGDGAAILANHCRLLAPPVTQPPTTVKPPVKPQPPTAPVPPGTPPGLVLAPIPPSAVGSPVAQTPGQLPFTGSSTVPLLLGGLGSVLFGSTLIRRRATA